MSVVARHHDYAWNYTIDFRDFFNLLYYLPISSFYFIQPDSPSKPTVSDIKATQMKVSWTPPDFGGSSFIIGYIVEYRQVTGKKWTKVNKTTDTSIVVNHLHEKTEYQFRVSAENQIGMGSCSKPSFFLQDTWYVI